MDKKYVISISGYDKGLPIGNTIASVVTETFRNSGVVMRYVYFNPEDKSWENFHEEYPKIRYFTIPTEDPTKTTYLHILNLNRTLKRKFLRSLK